MANATIPVIQINEGNVGIGTTSPANKLVVSVSTAGDYATLINNTNSTNGYGLLARTASTGTSSYAFAARAGSSDIFVVRADGNVGIGTTSPGAKLDVVGKINQTTSSGGTAASFTNSDATSGYGVAIQSQGTSATRYALILRNLDSSNVYGGVSTMTNQVGFWGIGASPTNTLGSRLTVGGNASIGSGYTTNSAPTNGLIVEGNVGIGDTTPSFPLVVSKSSSSTSNGNDTSMRLALSNPDQTNNNWALITFGDGTSQPGSGFMGMQFTDHTNNYGELSFGTRGAGGYGEKMRIDSEGNVGIGTTNPVDRLTIYDSDNNVGVYFQTATSGTSNGDGFRVGLNNSHAFLWNYENTPLAFATNGSQKATILANGNFGIGATSPGRQLTLSQSVSGETQQLLLVNRNDTNGDTSGILFGVLDNATYAKAGIFFERTDLQARGSLHFATDNSADSGHATKADARMTITHDGNVGIGTASPGATLQIGQGSANVLQKIHGGATAGIQIFTGGGAGTKIASLEQYFSNEGYLGLKHAGTTKIHLRANGFSYLNGGNVGIGTTAINGAFGASNTILAVKGKTSGGEGIIQITGLGNNANDNVGALAFHSYNEGDAMCSIRSIRGSGDDIGNMVFLTNNGGTESERMRISSAGEIKFNAYNSTNNTGTPTYLLGTDASGNVVKTNTVPGSGAGPYLPLTAGSSYPLTGDLYIDGNGSQNFHSLIFHRYGSSTNFATIGFSDPAASNSPFLITSSGNGNEMIIEVGAGDDIEFRSNDNSGTTSTFASIGSSSYFTGNVGIGATGPDSPLEVQFTEATGTAKQMLHIDYNSTNNYGSGYLKISAGGSSQALTFIEQVTSGGNGLFGTYIDTNIINKGLSASAHGNINFVTGSSTSASSIVMTIGGGSQKGNVGIGTTSPNNKLDVNGDVFINSNYTANIAAQDLTIGKTTTGDHGLTIVTGNANTASIFFADNNNNDAGRIKYQHSSNSMRFDTNRSEAMRINSSGNVGIGTTSPVSSLNITTTKTVALDTAAKFLTLGLTVDDLTAGNTAGGGGGIAFRSKNTNAGTQIVFGAIDAIKESANVSDFKGSLRFFTNQNSTGIPLERMRIDSSGNVGIGTTSPVQKLQVNGSVYSNGGEFFVNTNSGITAVGNLIFKGHNGTSYFEGMRLASTGNVGIGVTGPTTKLDVGGSVRIAAGSNLYFTSSNTTFKIQQDTTNSELDIYGGALVPAISIDNSSHLALPGYGLSGSGTPIKLLGLDSSSNVVTATSFNLILDDTPAASTTSGSGNIVNWSVSETVTAGTLYAVKTNGGWTTADADSEVKSTYMLAIALGSNATAGMLLQGFFYKSSHGFTIGAPLYVSNTAGSFSNSRPTGSGDYVRIIGYATSANYIYFDPDKTWIKLT